MCSATVRHKCRIKKKNFISLFTIPLSMHLFSNNLYHCIFAFSNQTTALCKIIFNMISGKFLIKLISKYLAKLKTLFSFSFDVLLILKKISLVIILVSFYVFKKNIINLYLQNKMTTVNYIVFLLVLQKTSSILKRNG